jgi:small-conductance mechanosensitive channel
MVSGGIVIGALVLAAKDEMKSVVGSIELHSLPKCQEGDYVKIIGTETIEGVITRIDYLHTSIDVKGEGTQIIVVPNSKLWESSLLINRPDNRPKCQVGDYIKLIGTDAVEGVITAMDINSTTLDAKGEGKQTIVLPTAKLSDAMLVIGKAQKEKKEDDKKVVVVVKNCCCHAGGCHENGGKSCQQSGDCADCGGKVGTADGGDKGGRSAGADA